MVEVPIETATADRMAVPGSTPAASMSRVALPCADLVATIDFFCNELGFQLDNIWPADSPARAIVSSPGLHLELRLDPVAGPLGAGRIIVVSDDSFDRGIRSMSAPNGTFVEIIRSAPVLDVPPLQSSFVVSQLDDDSSWITGRAGMRYRDLIPDRLGGRFISSHIEIPDGGPVPDYVHFHDVRFQMIFCARGWVEVVYEDQGGPFVLHAGDCVLQPPEIRHRVLNASPGLEVVEIGCPAEHLTTRDHDIELPTGSLRPDRDFAGQRFVRHVAAAADYGPWRASGMVCRDSGIGAATFGLAQAVVARPTVADDGDVVGPVVHHGEFLQLFILGGQATMDVDRRGVVPLERATSVVVPAGEQFWLSEISEDFEVLDVSL